MMNRGGSLWLRALLAGGGVVGLLAGLSCTVVDREDVTVAPEGSLALVGVNVIPMDRDTVLMDKVVVVREGVISKIEDRRSWTKSEGVIEVDGLGRYVMPGLIDSHTHPDALSEMSSFLRWGVTSVFVLEGYPWHSEWRDQLARGDVVGPSIRLRAGPILDGPEPINPKFVAIENVDDPEQVDSIVAFHRRQGLDLIKIYTLFPPAPLPILVAAARSSGLAVGGHVSVAIGLDGALRSGQQWIAHGEEIARAIRMGQTVQSAISSVAESGAWVTANISAMEGVVALTRRGGLDSVLAHPEMEFLPPAEYWQWIPSQNWYTNAGDDFGQRITEVRDLVMMVTKELSKAGVPIMAGTDAAVVGFPGLSLHEEIGLLVASGLSNFEALRAATETPGRFLQEVVGHSEVVGVVHEGAVADLLLLDANPLSGVANLKSIAGVVRGGEYFSSTALDSLRREAVPGLSAGRSAVRMVDSVLQSGDTIGAMVEAATAQRRYGDEPLLKFPILLGIAAGASPKAALSVLDFIDAAWGPVFSSDLVQAKALLLVGDSTGAVKVLMRARATVSFDARINALLTELRAGVADGR